MNNKSLRNRGDVQLDGKRHTVLSFSEKDDEFRIYIDAQTRLPAQTEILEDDPLEGDSSYTLRYGDWRKVDGVMLPFSLRYELNGKVLQEEQIRSIRHNLALGGDVFAIPESVRNEKTDATPIASQWILRRVAGNVSYQDMGRAPAVQWVELAPGVHKIQGGSHATILVEMGDHLVAVEGSAVRSPHGAGGQVDKGAIPRKADPLCDPDPPPSGSRRRDSRVYGGRRGDRRTLQRPGIL